MPTSEDVRDFSFLEKLAQIFPANRVAAIAAFLSGVAGEIVAITSDLPAGTATNVAIGVGGFLTQLATVVKFLQGAQNYDKLETEAYLAELDSNRDGHLGVLDVIKFLEQKDDDVQPTPVGAVGGRPGD